MWDLRIEPVEGGQRYALSRDGVDPSFREVFESLETNSEFRAWYSDVLASSDFEAFYWEHPALCSENYDTAAEFVLVDAPGLARIRPRPEPFARQFERGDEQRVISFPNLGGDAVLIVPRQVGSPSAYAHLAAFVRLAPADQIQEFWQGVGRVVRERVGTDPVWISTAGMGVSWLHARIDAAPKYYRFGPYKSAPAGTGNDG